MAMTDLLLKRATASPGEVYNVMCEERIVGRIMLSADAQFPWVWTLTYGYHEDRTPTHGYEPTRAHSPQPASLAFSRICSSRWLSCRWPPTFDCKIIIEMNPSILRMLSRTPHLFEKRKPRFRIGHLWLASDANVAHSCAERCCFVG